MRHPTLRLASTALLASLLAACGSDDGNSSTPAATLSGIVATGAAVNGATINAKCVVSSYSATSNASGSYSIVIPAANFPCVVRATGGSLGSNTLHSFASNTGTANITPLTDLALALQVNTAASQTLAAWFASPSNWNSISSGLLTALNNLRSALLAAGYTVPASWTAGSTAPFSSPFTPNPAIDAYDRLLEDLADAIANSGSYADYNALLSAFASGSSLPAAPEPEEEEPSAPANLALLTAYAGTYTVSGNGSGDAGYCASCGTANRNHARGSITIHANGNIDFDTGISFTATQIKAIQDHRGVATDKRLAVNFGDSDSNERIRLYFKASGTGVADLAEIIHDNGAGTTTRASIGEEEEEPQGGCSGDTKAAFTAVSGTHRLMAKYAYNNTADTGRYTNRGYYDVSVDSSNCTMSVTGADGVHAYGINDVTPQITSNAQGTDIRLEDAAGDVLFISYGHGDKKIFAGHLYQNSTYYWGLYGVDSGRCTTVANTIATPAAIGSGPYVIAYAGDKNLGIDQRSNVTATFSDNQGLHGYRASANEDWNRGCSKNNDAVGDSVIRIGKWHTGSSSPGYYETYIGFTYTAYEGMHYAIAQAVSNKPSSGSKSYTQPSGWNSIFTTSSITMGGSVTCNGAGGACVVVDFSSNTATVNMTVTDNAGASLTFNSSNLAIGQDGLIHASVSGSGTTGALRLLLGGNGASHIAGSVTISTPFGRGSRPTFGSLGLKAQP